MAMKRADRGDSNHDNAVNNPRSRQKEPTPPHELQQLLMTVRAQRDEWQQRAKENEEATSQLVHVKQEIQTYQIEANELKEQVTKNYRFYIDEQENHQKTLYLYNEEKAKISQLVHVHQREFQTCQLEANELKERVTQNYQFYVDEQQSHQQTLCFYNEEKARATEFLTKYQSVNSEREMYLTLYNEAKAELKHERRSKASIKGWETRRKAENEKLKREIAQMVVLLRESLESKDEAVNSLYVVAERMDRIQSLVDSVEEETTNNPMGLVQKFKRIWLAIKDILSE
jgi:chromosome segregation ATPase